MKTAYAFTHYDVEAELDKIVDSVDFDTFLSRLCAENNSRDIRRVLAMLDYWKPLYKLNGMRMAIDYDTAYAPTRIYWK